MAAQNVAANTALAMYHQPDPERADASTAAATHNGAVETVRRSTRGQRAWTAAGQSLRQIPGWLLLDFGTSLALQRLIVIKMGSRIDSRTNRYGGIALSSAQNGVSALFNEFGKDMVNSAVGRKFKLPSTQHRWWPYTMQSFSVRLIAGIVDASLALGVPSILNQANRSLRDFNNVEVRPGESASGVLIELLNLYLVSQAAIVVTAAAADWIKLGAELGTTAMMGSADFDRGYRPHRGLLQRAKDAGAHVDFVHRPPEFWAAVIGIGIRLTGLIVATGWLFSRTQKGGAESGYELANLTNASVRAAWVLLQPIFKDLAVRAIMGPSSRSRVSSFEPEDGGREVPTIAGLLEDEERTVGITDVIARDAAPPAGTDDADVTERRIEVGDSSTRQIREVEADGEESALDKTSRDAMKAKDSTGESLQDEGPIVTNRSTEAIEGEEVGKSVVEHQEEAKAVQVGTTGNDQSEQISGDSTTSPVPAIAIAAMSETSLPQKNDRA
jgi:hypothetical protein